MAARILIMEDNLTNMELMVYLLTAYGYAPETADDGKEGIEKAVRKTPDLVVCDLEMPGMNGFEVVQRLRKHVGSQCVPIIAVTAYAMVGDRAKVLAAGFDGYITKPIYAESFVKQLEAFLPKEMRSGCVPMSPEIIMAPETARQAQRAVILVVDDSEVNLNLIRSTLEPSGYTVSAITSVNEVLQQAQRIVPDLILSDVHMSPETGFGFLQSVKANPALRSIPFILLTASTFDDVDGMRKRALQLGAKRFLTGPIEPKSLLLLIDALLRVSREGQNG
jgi:two-component system, cell cycle response regulator